MIAEQERENEFIESANAELEQENIANEDVDGYKPHELTDYININYSRQYLLQDYVDVYRQAIESLQSQMDTA